MKKKCYSCGDIFNSQNEEELYEICDDCLEEGDLYQNVQKTDDFSDADIGL